MRKILRHIPGFSMLLAGFIIFAHLIIPHDHHSSDSLSDTDETCPMTSQKPFDHSGFPPHCHAFNNLLSEKAIKFVLDSRIINLDDAILFTSELADHQLTSLFYVSSGYEQSLFCSFCPNLYSLRAPPVFS
jgi:hypothetical protein